MSEAKLQGYLAGAERVTLVGPFVDEAKQYSEPILFVDGGVRVRRGTEGFSLGDGDSAAIPLDLTVSPEKDFSDFAFALRLLPDSVQRVEAYGFYGGRLDHTLANLGEARAFVEARPQRELHFEQGVSVYAPGSWQVEVRGIFSIFTLEEADILIHGDCRYSLSEPKRFLPLASYGLSNQGRGKIGVHASRAFILVRGEAKTF